MATNIQKFQLSQSGKNYILTSQIENGIIKLTCIESQIVNPPIYLGTFSLSQLCQMSKMFQKMSTIYEAQEFLNQSIENQKVRVESQGSIINVILYFQRETESEDIITTNYNTQEINYNTQPVVYNTVEEQQQYMQIPITTTETVENTVNYVPEATTTTYTDNNVNYETTYDNTANYENYQTYENINYDATTNIDTTNTETVTNYDYNITNAVEIPQVQNNTYVETTTTTQKETETLTLPLSPEPQLQPQPQYQQIDVSKYLLEIEQLKNQIKLLQEENYTLKQKTVITTTNKSDQSGEILLLKQEIERLKLQIEELLKNKRRLEELLLEAKKQIEQLKLQISQMMEEKSYTESIIRKQQNTSSGEKQTLTIQDTRLEIIKGDIIQTTTELEFLTRKICQNHNKITLNLLYKATIDSDKASVFHNKCDSAENSLVLIKSTNGKRFGGFTTCSWEGNSIEKKDDNAFVFSLDKMKIYDIIQGEDAIGCYPKYGPVFLGCQIRIYDEFFTKGGTTFEKGLNYDTQEDFELTGGLKKFDIKEIEVYGIHLE